MTDQKIRNIIKANEVRSYHDDTVDTGRKQENGRTIYACPRCKMEFTDSQPTGFPGACRPRTGAAEAKIASARG